MRMTDEISPQQFHDTVGVDDWRVRDDTASAQFGTGSFAAGVALVIEIGRLADAMDHHPDVDLRYPTVTVRLTSHDIGGLSERDVKLARQISAAARELGAPADPTAG
jgi:4a-hydroxytetrahydrobiopterin dehydratase